MFPWLVFLKRSGKKLSNIEYLAIKEFGGKLVKNAGTKLDGTTGDLATLTASAGKDMYLAKAHAHVRLDAASGLILFEVQLKVNGAVEDDWIGSAAVSSEGPTIYHYDFNIGYKVAATEIIKLEVITSDADLDFSGSIQCIEEDTNASPAV